jgi:hypothetical protein
VLLQELLLHSMYSQLKTSVTGPLQLKFILIVIVKTVLQPP